MSDTIKQEEEGPYGWGTGAAIEALLKRLGSHQIPTTGLILINLDTLIRNTVNTDCKIDEVVNKITTFMTNISNDLAEALSRWPQLHHHIVFYHANLPKTIPLALLRTHNGPTAIQGAEVRKKLLARLEQVKPQTINGVTSVIALSKDIKEPSYKGLADLCNKLAGPAVTVHMISHNPLDWHITKYGRPGILYRSHTGAVVKMTPNDLGPIVFDTKGVPFYPITHVVLGDKSVIKGVVAKNDRKAFIAASLKDRFVLRPESYIKSHAIINKSFLPYRFD